MDILAFYVFMSAHFPLVILGSFIGFPFAWGNTTILV